MEININELIDNLKADEALKSQLVNGLDLKLARDLPDDSKLKEVTDVTILKEYVTSLRDELDKKNEKFKSKESEILTELDQYKLKEKERLDLEKSQSEKSLLEQKKYNELIENLTKERDELRSKFESHDSILLTYKQKEDNEKMELLKKFPESDREIFKNLDNEQLKTVLSRIDKNVSSPTIKEIPNKNMVPTSLKDFENWTPIEIDDWINGNPSEYEKLMRNNYNKGI